MKRIISFFYFFVVTQIAYTQVMVKDIYPGMPSSMDTSECVAFRNKIIFSAKDNVHGRELWFCNSANLSTTLIMDINPGLGSSNPASFKELGNYLYFFADNGSNGRELWRTDGTTVGTTMVKDIWPGPSSGTLYRDLINFEENLYFAGNDGTNGWEPWMSDGTSSGTTILKNIYPMGGSSAPQRFLAFDDFFFFTAQDNIYRYELWRSDGTANGTYLVKNINPFNSSSPRNLTKVGDKLFFQADNGSVGTELWISDGTEIGTDLVKDITPGSASSTFFSLSAVDNLLYLSANDTFCISNGTAIGTKMIKAVASYTYYYPYKDKAYFAGLDYTNNIKLWVTDGTSNGTQPIGSIAPLSHGRFTDRFIYYSGGLYFACMGTTSEINLCRTYGTDASTIKLPSKPDFSADFLTNLTISNNRLFFSAKNGSFGAELAVFDADPLSIPENKTSQFFKAYPNPAQDKLFLTCSDVNNFDRVELFSLLGESVLSAEQTNEVTLLNIRPGLYFIKAWKDEKQWNEKIVIE